MSPLAFWGLPTAKHDQLLFGGPAWDSQRYQADTAVQQRRARDSGADIDLDPIATTDRIVNLTKTEADRSAILRRFRLFSRQPDEMITFMALQRMDPRRLDFDPRLYQYGGGYIYLIGAAIGGSALFDITHLTGDVGYYLADPDAFARFYVVARVVSLLFGALTLVAVYRLARRAGGGPAGWIALVFVACTPVFITGVLEAKPHLPSACAILWATLGALDFARHGRRRDAMLMGVFAGYAFGLVLTGIVALTLWPVLWFARRRCAEPGRYLLRAGILAAAVYLLTNPYVAYNALFDRAALQSNLSNSTAMYGIARLGAGALRVGELLVEGGGIAVTLLGTIGSLLLLRRFGSPIAIAAAPALALLLICILIGAGKPAEYARFLVVPIALICISAAAVIAGIAHQHRLVAWIVGVLVLALMKTPTYVQAFAVDSRADNESRVAAARYLRETLAPDETLAVVQVPAPYATPPLDFTRREVFLLPTVQPPDLDKPDLPPWLVCTADDDTVYAASWW